MRSLSTLFLLFAAGGAQAKFSFWQRSNAVPQSSSVNCTSTLEQAIVGSNETYLNIQGSQVESSCFVDDATVEASLLHVFSQDMSVFYDANGALYTGQDCDLVVSGRVEQQNDNGRLSLEIPIAKVLSVDCVTNDLEKRSKNNDRHRHRRRGSKKHKTTTTKKPTTTTKKRTTTTKKPTATPTKKPTTTTKKRTTTTTTKATPTSSSGEISGQVTWFNPNVGACGDENSDNDMIAALGGFWYGNMDSVSKYCGKKISITGPKGNSIILTVKDACPPCAKGHVDISPAAFRKLGDLDDGILKVKWHFL